MPLSEIFTKMVDVVFSFQDKEKLSRHMLNLMKK